MIYGLPYKVLTLVRYPVEVSIFSKEQSRWPLFHRIWILPRDWFSKSNKRHGPEISGTHTDFEEIHPTLVTHIIPCARIYASLLISQNIIKSRRVVRFDCLILCFTRYLLRKFTSKDEKRQKYFFSFLPSKNVGFTVKIRENVVQK